MNIIILNLYYPPDTGATAKILRDVAKVLAKRHSVTVIAGRPSYDPSELHPYYLSRTDTDGDTVIKRVGSTAFHRKRMVGRSINFLSYMILAFVKAMTIKPKPDLIIAMTDPPVISLVGAVIGLTRGCPWIYNIRDLHPDMAQASGIVKNGFFVSVWDRIHRWAMTRASLIIALGDDMKERIISKGVAPGRVVVVRDGANNVAPTYPPKEAISQEIRRGFSFVVVHAGNLGFAGAWDTLIKAASHLEQNDVGFTFIGDGVMRPDLELKTNQMNNVSFLPFQTEENVQSVLAAADLHIVTLRTGLEGLVVPSKLYPILMAGRPVLAVTPESSDVARIVQKYECGFVADPEDPISVSKAIQAAQADKKLLADMSKNAKNVGVLFSRSHELDRFITLVDQTISQVTPS